MGINREKVGQEKRGEGKSNHLRTQVDGNEEERKKHEMPSNIVLGARKGKKKTASLHQRSDLTKNSCRLGVSRQCETETTLKKGSGGLRRQNIIADSEVEGRRKRRKEVMRQDQKQTGHNPHQRKRESTGKTHGGS